MGQIISIIFALAILFACFKGVKFALILLKRALFGNGEFYEKRR